MFFRVAYLHAMLKDTSSCTEPVQMSQFNFLANVNSDDDDDDDDNSNYYSVSGESGDKNWA
jgi:hypothetical protein